LAIKIRFDYENTVQEPVLILANKSGKFIRQLPIHDTDFKENMNNGSTFTFYVNKSDCVDIDGNVDSKFWKQIKDFKLAYCKEYDRWFELYIKLDESTSLTKSIKAESLGKAELSQINVYGLEANTEDDIARDDYSPTILYDPNNPKTSLIDRILNKAPHYRIGHVDSSIAGLQRTFSFDEKTIDDAFQEVATEIDCLVEYECKSLEDGHGIDRVVNVYDLESVCRSCGKRGTFISVCDSCGSTDINPGYGEDTTVYVSSENLADEISYETDTGSVKNCFRLVAGDDLMTATIANCNPNGSGYIWYISDDVKEDMSDELLARIEEYDDLYEYYQSEYNFTPTQEVLDAYNALVEKYKSLQPDLKEIDGGIVGYPALMQMYYDVIDLRIFLSDKMLPQIVIEDTTAERQAAKLSLKLSTVAVTDVSKCTKMTATSAVLSFARSVVDERYNVKVESSNYDNGVWTGSLSVANNYDEEDIATASIYATVTDDFEAQARQKIEIVLSGASNDNFSPEALFTMSDADFIEALTNYNLSSLNYLNEICTNILNVLIGQGIADSSKFSSSEGDLYEELYSPYYAKLGYIENETAVRENEISTISGDDGLQSQIDSARDIIHKALDFQAFIGNTLWAEFVAYRREDTYKNENYISDGLTTEEVFRNALEFLEVAKKEIYKSATSQHVITSSLKNLLVMQEFSPIVDHFAVGNWIRLRVDDEVYRLRLLEYQIDYEKLDSITVTFSDVKKGAGAEDDLQSVLNQAQSMATSFGAVVRQASKGNKSSSYVFDWINRGMDLTNTKIISNADNQDIVYDKNGLVAREYIPFLDGYDDKQVKLINSGLYVTDDGWKTAKTGVGEFIYWNPESKSWETDFGVVAKMLVSSLMLSENVRVYNQNNTIALGDSGVVITTEADANNENGIAFTIRRRVVNEDGNEIFEPIMSVNNEGRLVLDGSVNITTLNSGATALDAWIDTVNSIERSYHDDVDRITASIAELKTQGDNITIRVSQLENVEDPDAYEIKSTGYRFDADGLKIRRNQEEIENKLDNTGMFVRRYTGNQYDNILEASINGVNAINVSVRQFLIIGDHARFESYTTGRTGCFYI